MAFKVFLDLNKWLNLNSYKEDNEENRSEKYLHNVTDMCCFVLNVLKADTLLQR